MGAWAQEQGNSGLCRTLCAAFDGENRSSRGWKSGYVSLVSKRRYETAAEGRNTVNVVPTPGSLVTLIQPPCSLTMP